MQVVVLFNLSFQLSMLKSLKKVLNGNISVTHCSDYARKLMYDSFREEIIFVQKLKISMAWKNSGRLEIGNSI